MLVLDGIGGVDLRGVKGGLTKLVRVGRGKGHMLFGGNFWTDFGFSHQ